jgi:glucose/mannose-6-phosphate isomerase
MLDDLKLIHEKDAQDALGIAEKQWQQLEYNFEVDGTLPTGEIANVVVAGMGGSALAALLLTSWPGINLPFQICRDYDLPSYVGPNTLVIASSYSGNTEETVSCLNQAMELKAKIVVMAGGGKLIDIAKENKLAYITLPPAGQPRFAALYGLNALVTLFGELNLIPAETLNELKDTANFVKQSTAEWGPMVAKSNNIAKQYAYEVIGNTPVIYAGQFLFPAAYKWKISFNENAKNVAWCNQYPEFNHNEFLGWSSHPLDKPYRIFDLRSSLDNPQITKRFEISDKLLSGRRPSAIVVNAKGETKLQQILWTVALGDFVSIYTAILNGLNPTPVDLIEKLKKQL